MSDIRILLVDDEEFYLRLFGDFLSARRYQIHTARSGEEALTLLARQRFDLLITDLLMEGMDGLTLTERVRALYPWVDVIVITQRDDVRLAVRSMKMGVFEYLVKPVDRDELLLTIDRLLERRRLLDNQNKLLDESMEYLQAQTVYRRCLEILSTLDFENLCEMILRHMCQATAAQGGLLWLTSPEERAEEGSERFNLAGYRGLVTLEDFPSTLVVKDGPFLESYRSVRPFVADPSAALGLPLQGRSDALFIPLSVDGGSIGLLLLQDKLHEDFHERDQNIASTMAEFSAIALKNSRRFQALERIGLRDPSSTAYNLTYFIDYAGKEIYKARRYSRSFSLINVIIDRFEFLQEHLKAEVCGKISRRLVENISRVVRDSDILARVSDHEYYVLLPETDALGARMFIRRCGEAFSADAFIAAMARDYSMPITLGAATYPMDGDDFDRLLAVCREEMDRARNSVFRRLHLDDRGFWDAVDLLLGRAEDYVVPLPQAGQAFRLAEAEDGSSTHGLIAEPVLEAIEEEVIAQAVDSPDRRAICYVLGGTLGPEPRPAELALSRAELAKGYIIGRRAGDTRGPDSPAVTRVYLDSEVLDRSRVLLVLSERLAYTLVGGRREDGRMAVFHSCDRTLTEGLIAKLQVAYNFQRQY